MNFNRKKILVFIILLAVGLAIYGNSFNNEFFWDDDDSIVNNVYIKDWQFLPKYFTENLIAGAGQITDYWRPALLVSFALDYHLWGLLPFGFHLTNTLLHVIAAYLVFLLLYQLTMLWRRYSLPSAGAGNGKRVFILPFLVSLFFLIHPLQTEAVTYIAGRADSLSSVFSLLAILFYVNCRLAGKIKVEQDKLTVKNFWSRNWRYLASLMFFILGLLTKEQVILLPALIVLVELIFITKRLNKQSLVNVIKLSLPFFLLAAIYLAIRLLILNFDDLLHVSQYGQVYDSHAWYRLLTFGLVMTQYFKLLFIPTGLHMAREVSAVTSFFSWPVLIFIALLILIAVVSVKTWRRNRLITFGFLWFFIILLPRTNIFQINRPMYEHWLYLPMIGFWLAFFSLVVLIFQEIKKRKARLARPLRYAGFSFVILAMAGFSLLTILRNNDWQDPITFYEKNLRYTPNSFIQRNNLGMAYADKGRLEDSVRAYKRAIEIKDVYAQVHHNLANSLRDLGRQEEAIEEYKKAISMSPSFQYPYNNLLGIYLNHKNKAGAEEVLKKMKVAFSAGVDYLRMAGMAYYSLEEYDRAIEVWRELLEIKPDDRMIRELLKEAKSKKARNQ